MFGYNGRMACIDLTTGKIEEKSIPEEVFRNFLGGSGLAAKIFLDEFDFTSDALSENNPLIFATGPLTAGSIPGCVTRFSVCGRSPLTDIWGESSNGGSFGVYLKRAGFDALVVKGKANEMVYITIVDDKIEIKSASHLVGKDTYQVWNILKNEGFSSSVSIGIAGENKVLFANIASDPGNYAGRCGFGALAGSKNLKAIAVKGTKKIEIANKDEMVNLRRQIVEKMKSNIAIEGLTAFGSDSVMALGMMLGDVPIKNWSKGIWDEGGDALSGSTMADTILIKGHSCYGCIVNCKRVVKVDEEKYKVEEGPGPEYETCAAFGTLLFNKNLSAVAKANELCNRFGMDTISCGSTIAWAIECYEKGILTDKDTDGLKLNWGNIDDVIVIIEKIAKREGIGNILADGSKKASRKISRGSEKFLTDVKGLEAPMHDPRAFHGVGLQYATGNRGACHVNTSCMYIEHGFCFYPEIGLGGPYEAHSAENKAQLNVGAQNIGSIFNSACICMFAGIPFSAQDILDAINYTTGFNWSLDDMMKVGERIWYIKRGINNLFGITRKDDYLPEKILTPLEEGGTNGTVPDIKTMLNEFYKLRELDEEGKVKKEKLEELGIGELAKKIYG